MLPVFQPGEFTEVTPDQLAIPKARQLANLVARGRPFVRFLRAERHDLSRYEAVVLEVEVELGQKTIHPIQRFEPLAFIFDPEDRLRQEVWALRPGFPITPHQNLTSTPEPRSLCLYEEPYADQKMRWSAFALLERARGWLRLASRGELHQEDQPLEPLLAHTENTAILPHDFFTSITGKDFVPTSVARMEGADDHFILVLPHAKWSEKQVPGFVLSPFITPPVEHGIITHQPSNLFQLQQFCQKASLDLVKELRDRIRAWKTAGNLQHLATSKLIICLLFPKVRHAATQAESRDIWLFATGTSLLEVGVAVGILEVKSGLAGLIIPETQPQTAAVEKVQIRPVRPTFALDASSAAILNGTPPDKTKIVAIGLGAVGSHVFDNLVKSGFGSWTLVDEDHLLPHNCARHVLDASAMTMPKAEAMRIRASNIVPDLSATAIVANVLDPGDKTEPLTKAYNEAEVILDMSASTAVAKHLALDVSAAARRASIFLNPAGDTLVMLMEDKARTATLDWLEMVYYFGLPTNPDLADHFESPSRFRYSRSCGDISSRISQDLVALHSATASRTLRTRLQNSEPAVLLSRVQPDFSTKLYAFPVRPPSIQTVGGWTILTDPLVFKEAARLRESKLPNETGAVLLGSMDTHHRRIYVVALLPSPPDSQEWPSLYIRGAAGLRNRVQEVSNATYNTIDYIGEWHSHPPRSSAETSTTDRLALSKLAEEMRVAGLPALMLIVAGAQRHQFHIHQVDESPRPLAASARRHPRTTTR
jgi:hypothetical protein